MKAQSAIMMAESHEQTPQPRRRRDTLVTAAAKLRAALITTRPRQWVKNLFVVAPLIFSKHLLDLGLALRSLGAFAIFCALSGAVYAFNDVGDAELDRHHPVKKERPIAAGQLSERAGLLLAAMLALFGLAASAFYSPSMVAVVGAYLVTNLAYSLYLKRIAFLDVILISFGFLLRVMAGAIAIAVPVSGWLFACTALLSALLAFGKRAHELWQLAEARKVRRSTRIALGGYRHGQLRLALALLAVATSVAYALYTQDERTVHAFGTRELIFTLPFCVLGILRFLQLAVWRPRRESPTDAILRDLPFLAIMFAWGVTVLAIIYRS
jgi:4-hydroxybenzoate polyprenyltransferase